MFHSRIININISCRSESTLLYDFSLTLQLVLRKKWAHQKTCWFTIGMQQNYSLDRWILQSGVYWKQCVVKRFNFNSVIEHLIHFPSELLLVLWVQRERTHSSSLIVIWSEQEILIWSVLQRVVFGSPPPSNANIPYVYCIDRHVCAKKNSNRKFQDFLLEFERKCCGLELGERTLRLSKG